MPKDNIKVRVSGVINDIDNRQYILLTYQHEDGTFDDHVKVIPVLEAFSIPRKGANDISWLESVLPAMYKLSVQAFLQRCGELWLEQDHAKKT